MTSEEFKENVYSQLPSKPGIYQYYDSEGGLLYVGKAKNLKKRVSSYFLKSKADSHRLKLLVKKTHKIHFAIVETEHDAFLLENNIIKEQQPRYNIQLKDDKSFPFICIKNERFPRIFLTRTVEEDGSQYLGPFTSVKRVKDLLNFIRQLYPIRTCNFKLSEENIMAGKFKTCLEYQIGNCLGPCEDKQSEEDYNKSIQSIKNILKGKFSEVAKLIKEEIRDKTEVLAFEEAHKAKMRLALLEKFQSKSTIVNPRIDNIEVYDMVTEGNKGFINYFQILNGTIASTQSFKVDKKLDESDDELLAITIMQIREKYQLDSPEVVVPYEVILPIEKVVITIPERGEKRKLLDLCHKNAVIFKSRLLSNYEKAEVKKQESSLLEQMKNDLRLSVQPKHIECFDNSNIQGTHPVASMVVFKNAKPARSEYRHFHIKTVEGPDDFASMKEVVFRRYKRLLEEKKPLPDLVVIDGGKGQLSAAMEAVDELNIRKEFAVISIAKKLEELYYPGDKFPLHISKKSTSLRVIQHIRNEAHRFAITFHRQLRSKHAITNQLSEIPGIGKGTIDLLMSKYKSIENIKKSPKQEIEMLVGQSRAKKIQNWIKSQA